MQNHNEMYFIPTRIAIIKKIEVLVRMWRKWNPHKMLVGMYGWPLNKTGVRGTDTSYSQKFTYNLQLALHICVDLDLWIQTTAGCVLLECLLLKKSTYKWTCTVQAHIVQGSTIISFGCLLIFFPKTHPLSLFASFILFSLQW